MVDKLKAFWENEWLHDPESSRSTTGYAMTSIDRGSVLDVGCGDLRYCNFPDRVDYFCGVDISHNALYAARQYHKKGRFVQSSAVSLPFPNNYFDAVVSMSMLTILGSSFYRALQEMVRISKKGLFFTLSHRENALAFCKKGYKETDCATLIEDSGMEKAYFTEENVRTIAERLKIKCGRIDALTMDEILNFGRPLYELDIHVEHGDKKAIIYVDAEK